MKLVRPIYLLLFLGIIVFSGCTKDYDLILLFRNQIPGEKGAIMEYWVNQESGELEKRRKLTLTANSEGIWQQDSLHTTGGMINLYFDYFLPGDSTGMEKIDSKRIDLDLQQDSYILVMVEKAPETNQRMIAFSVLDEKPDSIRVGP